MERETDHVLPFLDVLINNTDPHQSVTTVYWKKTFTGLLTSYLSFCPFTYRLGLIKTLIHGTFKILKQHLDGVPYWPSSLSFVHRRLSFFRFLGFHPSPLNQEEEILWDKKLNNCRTLDDQISEKRENTCSGSPFFELEQLKDLKDSAPGGGWGGGGWIW